MLCTSDRNTTSSSRCLSPVAAGVRGIQGDRGMSVAEMGIAAVLPALPGG